MSTALRVCLTVLFVSLLTVGCDDDTLRPEDLDVTGAWMMSLGRAPSEFEFSLLEESDGRVTGTWSYPSQFAHHPVHGRRAGERLTLRADSPNSHPTTLDVRFVRPGLMEGTFYFGTAVHDVTLGRK